MPLFASSDAATLWGSGIRSQRGGVMTTLATNGRDLLRAPEHRDAGAVLDRSEFPLRARVHEILNRRPAVGLVVGVVRDGGFEFCGHGVANIAANAPVTEDTVFRVGSITKLFTAIAVMQLWERGDVDLDAPANDYLHAYQLVPAKARFGPVTLRHLLTHTAGIPDMRNVNDLLHASFTVSGGRPPILSVDFGKRLPSLAEYYRGGLRAVVEPGSSFAYSNHGYATLGQIVEDVSGMPLERYFREHIFEPLGMADSDLVRSERIASRLATGYALGRHGAKPVPDRDWIGGGFGGIYSTARDMARFVAALLGGGANDQGRVLEPGTLATMFEPHYQADARLPGIGLGFFRADAAGHRLVFHDGILPGFNSELLLVPDDGVGVIGITNGSSGAFAWLQVELERMLRELLDLPLDAPRSDLPHHPEVWAEVCGRYSFPPRIADLRERLMLGAGAEVLVRGGRLMVRLLTPVPALYRGLPLDPDDATDPYAFRLDMSQFGMAPLRVVFARVVDGRATEVHTDLGGQPWSLVRVPDARTRRAWLMRAGGVLAVAGAVTAVRRRPGRAST
jgi:CubicO group peptidase (beta-lactamase class C family)